MGSVVAMAYMLKHQGRVLGLMNMDGFPASFHLKGPKFLSASRIHALLSWVVSTGALRLPLRFAKSFFETFSTPEFPAELMVAQMNRPAFWQSMSLESKLMIDLAARSNEGWGPLSCNALPKDTVAKLARVRKRSTEAMK